MRCFTIRWIAAGVALALIGSPAVAGSNHSTTAQAVASIIASVNIQKTQDLSFGTAAPGDNAKTIAPTDSTNAAAFNVTGQPNKVYVITLPSTTVTMTTGAGVTADEQIDVTTFASSPSGTGTLDVGGSQTLFVGATRATIRSTQTTGNYQGTFTVTVAYQ